MYVVKSARPVKCLKKYKKGEDDSDLIFYLYSSKVYVSEKYDVKYLLTLHMVKESTNQVQYSLETLYNEMNEHIVSVFLNPIMGAFEKDFPKQILKFSGEEMTVDEYKKIFREWKKSLLVKNSD
jgi:hypothetical protein